MSSVSTVIQTCMSGTATRSTSARDPSCCMRSGTQAICSRPIAGGRVSSSICRWICSQPLRGHARTALAGHSRSRTPALVTSRTELIWRNWTRSTGALCELGISEPTRRPSRRSFCSSGDTHGNSSQELALLPRRCTIEPSGPSVRPCTSQPSKFAESGTAETGLGEREP